MSYDTFEFDLIENIQIWPIRPSILIIILCGFLILLSGPHWGLTFNGMENIKQLVVTLKYSYLNFG